MVTYPRPGWVEGHDWMSGHKDQVWVDAPWSSRQSIPESRAFQYRKKGYLCLYFFEGMPVAGLLLFGLLFWLGSQSTRDFGLNFFTEMLGVAVTIFVIDRLIQRGEVLKKYPAKISGLRGSKGIHHQVHVILEKLVQRFCPGCSS